MQLVWMKRFVVAVALTLGSGAGCDLPQSKVALGQLYLSGEARYDAYFKDVHAIQVWAAEWQDDRRATRRPLVTILDLTPDAADVTIIQATHEKISNLVHDGGIKLETQVDEAHVVASGNAKNDAGLFRAVEETATGELQRAKKLDSMLPKMDDLTKVGHSLEPHVQDTFQRQTPGKMAEVRNELQATFDVLGTIEARARRAMRECDDFVADLQRAVDSGSEAGARHDRAPRASDERGDKTDKADKADKPDKPKKDEKPETKPAPKPKPKPEAPAKPAPVAKQEAKKDDTPKPAPPPAPPKPAKPPEGEVFNP